MLSEEPLDRLREGKHLTKWQCRVFKNISHRVASIPSDFHGSLIYNSRNQSLDRLLDDFGKPGSLYVRWL